MNIRRYDFPVPEWCRIKWVSTQARELWQPRMSAISAAWAAAELNSVGDFRKAARQSIAADQMVEFTTKAAQCGLSVVVLGQQATGGMYQSATKELKPGMPWQYNVVLADTPQTATLFAAAWKNSDNAVMGDLLGFPRCCISFFELAWVKDKWRDTTWPMVAPTATSLDAPQMRKGALEANTLLRWLGVRFVPHLPCSFECEHSAAFGKLFRNILPKDEAEWMAELLDSPIEWSAYHGIAEIKHPLFTISTKTDATVERLIIRREGPRYPEGASRGTVFPYLRHLPKSAEVKPLDIIRASYWQDNGFASQAAMEKAHTLITDFVKVNISANANDRVLDLGCGNGLLARKLSRHAFGIESDSTRAKRAVSGVSVRLDTIENFVKQAADADVYDTVVINPKRLTEMSAEDAEIVRDWLFSHSKRVVVYSYAQDLLKQCVNAKLALLTSLCQSNDACIVGIVSGRL